MEIILEGVAKLHRVTVNRARGLVDVAGGGVGPDMLPVAGRPALSVAPPDQLPPPTGVIAGRDWPLFPSGP